MIELDVLHSTLDGVTSAVMLADHEFRITHLNAAAQKLFEDARDRFSARFPGFDPARLVGQTMDAFHVNPAHQRALMGDPGRLPYQTTIHLDGLVVGLTVNAVRGSDGGVVGFALEWSDRTAQVLYEAEIERLHKAASAGDLDFEGDVASMAPEFAQVLGLVNDVFGGMKEVVTTVRDHLSRASDGDLSHPIEADWVGDHAVLRDAFNKMVNSLSESLREVSDAAEQISSGSTQVASTAHSVAQGASTQAEAVVQIKTTITSVADQAKAAAFAAQEVDRMSTQAGEAASLGDERMGRMLKAMEQIQEASQHISRVVKVIDEIAFQTNLLALNAAVEAARAGVHGRGFAVVAEEVRNLAARSAKAARETTEMIEDTMSKIGEGSRAAHETAEALAEIVSNVQLVRALVQDINQAAAEQAKGVADVDAGLTQIDGVTQANAAAAEQSAAAAEELSSQARRLTEQLSGFSLAEPADGHPTLPTDLSPELLAALQAMLSQQGQPAWAR